MLKKKYLLLYLAIALILVLSGIKGCQIYRAIKASAKNGPPPATVNTYIVKTASWPLSTSAVGTVRAVQGARLSAEASGRIKTINFKSGEKVKAGDVLLELDSAVELAELNAAEANFKLAEQSSVRAKKLRSKNANSTSDLQKAEAEYQLSQAEIERLKSVIERRKIIAPFDGTVGVFRVNPGEYVTTGTQIVDLNDYDKLYIDFYLPQDDIKDIALNDEVKVSISEENKVIKGRLTAINSQIDASNRNVLLQATIKNQENLLRPGMFVNVTLYKKEIVTSLVIPVNSIKYSPYGNTVYSVVKAKEGMLHDIEAHTVTLGRVKGDFIEVLSGLKANTEIVASGAFKLFPGIKVIIYNDIKAPLSTNPEVENS